jgi:hypothetical protein
MYPGNFSLQFKDYCYNDLLVKGLYFNKAIIFTFNSQYILFITY